jgi:type II secretory pathway pseudopilin PulG
MKQELSHLTKKEWSTTKQGFLLVEVLLASSVFILFLTAFAGVFYYGQEALVVAGNKSRAIMFAQEGQEAVRSMKNVNFANVSNGTYGLVYTNNAWSLSGTQDVSGVYTRQVVISQIDANRKNVIVNVTWQQTPQRTGAVSLTSRVTNWKTILNLGQGLMVNAIVINHGLSKTAVDFTPYKVGTTTVSLATSTKFGAGTYTVSSATDSNYTQTFTGDCNVSGQVTLTSSSSKLCTVTFEEKLAYFTASSTVINHGSSKVASDFAPYKIGSTTVTLNAATPINSGTYTVSEATSSQYILTYSGGCFTNGTVTLLSGDSKTCMLTNEEMQMPGGSGGSQSLAGILIYGDGTTVPKYRTYNQVDNTFAAETPTFTATVGPTWLIRTSPTSHIALAGYYDNTSTLTIMCFDGTTWTKEFAAQSGGVGNRHRFDITFEKSTGDALVLYSKGAYANGKLGYRTKGGATGCGQANWSAESLYTPLRTSNDIMYVKMAQDKRASSTNIAATWVDINDDISTAIWNGSSWVNEPSTVTDTGVQVVSSSHDIEDMDIEYESLSGNLMLVWANSAGNNGVNGVRYRRCTGGTATCTWGAVTTPPTFLDDATSLDIAANLTSNEIVLASIGKGGGDLQLGYWDGSTWTDTANVDTSCTVPYTASKLVSVGWLTYASTTRSVVVYSDLSSPNINWYLGNGGVFTRQTDFTVAPQMASSRGYMDIHMNPLDPAQLMYLTSDTASALYAKRLLMTGTSTFLWSNSDGGALETTLPQQISSPFSFAFWQK